MLTLAMVLALGGCDPTANARSSTPAEKHAVRADVREVSTLDRTATSGPAIPRNFATRESAP